jgi:hypothetical protein
MPFSKGSPALTREPRVHSGKLASLDKRIERGIGALAGDVADIAAEVEDLNAGIRVLKADRRLSDHTLAEELRHIRAHLDSIDRSTGSHAGYAKEIDYAFERISAIEKHLGIDKKIAA